MLSMRQSVDTSVINSVINHWTMRWQCYLCDNGLIPVLWTTGQWEDSVIYVTMGCYQCYEPRNNERTVLSMWQWVATSVMNHRTMRGQCYLCDNGLIPVLWTTEQWEDSVIYVTMDWYQCYEPQDNERTVLSIWQWVDTSVMNHRTIRGQCYLWVNGLIIRFCIIYFKW